MGGPSNGGGGGRTDSGQMNSTTATKIGVGNIDESGKKTKSYKSNNPDAFRNRGAEDIKKGIKGPPSVRIVGEFLSKPLQAGSKVTRDFFTDKVLGSKNYKNVSKTEFLSMDAAKQEMMYDTYISNRQSGATDAYGNVIDNRDNQGGGSYKDPNKVLNQPKVDSQMNNTGVKSTLITADKTAPTTTEMSEDQNMIDVKRRGRKATMLTSDLNESTRPTLSKKVLLGG